MDWLHQTFAHLIPEFLKGNSTWLWWLTALSVLSFVGCIVGIPWYLARAPISVLLGDPKPWRGLSYGALARRVLKNLLGAFLFLMGLVMLIGPGQGILTLIVALGLLDIPGKKRIQRRFLLRPRVLRFVNKLRRRAQQPLIIEELAELSR